MVAEDLERLTNPLHLKHKYYIQSSGYFLKNIRLFFLVFLILFKKKHGAVYTYSLTSTYNKS